jgi:hypothetical protein
MSKLPVFILIAAIASAASAAPAFAQSSRQRGHVTAAGRQAGGMHAFARVPAAAGGGAGPSTYDPALTGGGSLGYNTGMAVN